MALRRGRTPSLRYHHHRIHLPLHPPHHRHRLTSGPPQVRMCHYRLRRSSAHNRRSQYYRPPCHKTHRRQYPSHHRRKKKSGPQSTCNCCHKSHSWSHHMRRVPTVRCRHHRSRPGPRPPRNHRITMWLRIPMHTQCRTPDSQSLRTHRLQSPHFRHRRPLHEGDRSHHRRNMKAGLPSDDSLRHTRRSPELRSHKAL